ncbi:MAG: CmpA/NrtA family ABC transporter substrate-binding protein [Verrucomicrobiota bacterium]|nr:ABC transporter substrate-binding protein [Limisphaera sp.]MDW8381182.1 CmpA/NrtA family ABC transporter substrate-binding protein [Verrucomicrobiota bacterium]
MGGVYASEAPEVATLRIGLIALTDCAPIVIAHEKGYFRKHGLQTTLVKAAGWAAIRDALSVGDLHATHMLLGMPLASTMGLAGSPKVPMIIPWILNRNGQAITLAIKYRDRVRTPQQLKAVVEEALQQGRKLTFAITFPSGTHAMWLRYWLGAAGVHPDRDIMLITVPPPQMVANMKVGKMDGYCVGEPWNARAIEEQVGYTVVTTQEIWRDHPEKVCAFTESYAEQHPKTVRAVLRALHEASVWADQMENRAELCQIVSRPNYINCDPASILGRLQGEIDYGDGRKEKDEYHMIFSKRQCNYPSRSYALWFLSQYRRWGLCTGAPDYEGIARRVMRSDLYLEAMKEFGVTAEANDEAPLSLFDGTFDPREPERYARSFPIHNLRD